MKDEKKGVLLLGFGAAEKTEDVEDFIAHICQGQKPPEQVIKAVKEKYSAMGGGSPLLAATGAQAKGLKGELKKLGKDYPVYIGMLHSSPFIFHVVQEMFKAGIENIAALSLAPFYSEVSTGAYFAQVKKSLEHIPSHLRVSYGGDWHIRPFFIRAWRKKVFEALSGYPHPEKVHIIFTAHSLPLDHPEDALGYRKQYQAAVQSVMEEIPNIEFTSAYQSKGKRNGSWLSPSVEEVLERLSLQGEKSVLAVPLGFVADHLETMYDLDIEIKKLAELKGIDFRRASALNDDPLFLKGLAELVLAMG